MKNKYPVSIIIPVYKNYDMFYRFLAANKKFFDGCEVIVMNDYPLEDISGKVKNIYSDAIVFNNKKNLGFAGNVNQGVLQSKRDFIFLMNSDVVLRDAMFLSSLQYFKDDDRLFAVGFAQIEKDGKVVGANRGYFKDGLVHHSARSFNIKHPTPNFWAEGGSSIFRKALFTKLGLLDELYNPFYWEDIDLSYRAWKAGYTVIFDPKIEVEHYHESTIGKYFDKSKIIKTAFRNQIIFNWKNISDRRLIMDNLSNMAKFVFMPGFFQAVLRLPAILQSRKKALELFIVSDQKILDKFK